MNSDKTTDISDLEFNEIQKMWPHIYAIILFPVPISLMAISGFLTPVINIISLVCSLIIFNSLRARLMFFKKYPQYLTKRGLYSELVITIIFYLFAILFAISITIDSYVSGSSLLISIASIIAAIYKGFAYGPIEKKLKIERSKRL